MQDALAVRRMDSTPVTRCRPDTGPVRQASSPARAVRKGGRRSGREGLQVHREIVNMNRARAGRGRPGAIHLGSWPVER